MPPILGRVRSFGRRTCKSRFTEEQIIKVLKEHAAGLSAGDVCRKHGISDATFYKWRSRFGGMEVSDARRLKALEEESFFLLAVGGLEVFELPQTIFWLIFGSAAFAVALAMRPPPFSASLPCYS